MAKPSMLCLTATLFIFLIISQSSSARLLKDSSHPCKMGQPTMSFDPMELAVAEPKRLRSRYGPLFLSMLPKGSVPPSGPSKGTNNMNN
ncbi:hypothetical protein Acr_24g0012850 [Actinidia rufa]|uniref:Transmembrane protein n=1 Tax=Actinidia rufa TaxID=165716 RepID=A0A7J0GW62_9ERIC|nr:hypothetical protein Acr_24g0012850 [Actinidia rufa]